MEKITARSNEKIKYAALLASSCAKRTQYGEFLLEGARLCADAAGSGVEIIRVFFTGDALTRYGAYAGAVIDRCGECCEISDEVAEKLSDTGNTQGIFAVCRMASVKAEIKSSGKYLALENIQDPSNMGAICRSAEALGLDGLIISAGCDLYNPKVLRSAMGSSLRMDIIHTDDLCSLLSAAKSKKMLTLAAVPTEDAADIRSVNYDCGVICCIGNEGNGLREETISQCDTAVKIPMAGRAESLNASAAAAILAWELKR